MAYDRITCPKCEANFGQEIKFIDHLSSHHSIDDPESFYVETRLKGVRPTCSCSPQCELLLPWAGWKKGYLSKYARGHNARVNSVYINPERQAEFAAKRKEGYESGKYTPWNKGLSKESDERVKVQSEKISKSLSEGYLSGSIIDWRVGNEEKALLVAKKSSETKKKKFAEGKLTPWNKGTSKHDDPRLAKLAESIIENYKENPEASHKRFSESALLEIFNEYKNFQLLTPLKDYRNKYQKLEFKCKTCNKSQFKNIVMLKSTPVCFSCHPKESKGQLEILEFVRSLGVEAVSNDRSVISPLELDVYIPEKKLGIEYHGLYWHSTKVIQSKTKDNEKIKAATAAEVKLLIIYEDEWRDKRAIVEGMIRHRLGLSSRKFNARTLTLRELTSNESKIFFQANHLEGSVTGKVAFGLVHPHTNEILAGMSLRRPFHTSKSNRLEVGRSACLTDSSVRGWIGRLTKACHEYSVTNGFDGLMTYVDNRVGSGSGYASNIWKLDRESTGARFWWTDFTNRFNRFKYRADKARGLTQRQVADEAGVVEIWGCSNSTYITNS